MNSCALEPVWLDTRSSGSWPKLVQQLSRLCAHTHLSFTSLWNRFGTPPLNQLQGFFLERLGGDQNFFKHQWDWSIHQTKLALFIDLGLNLPLSMDYKASLEKLGDDQEHFSEAPSNGTWYIIPKVHQYLSRNKDCIIIMHHNQSRHFKYHFKLLTMRWWMNWIEKRISV